MSCVGLEPFFFNYPFYTVTGLKVHIPFIIDVSEFMQLRDIHFTVVNGHCAILIIPFT